MNRLKVAYCSDLHLDNFKFFNGIVYPPLFNPKDDPAEVLIIAGDMGEYKYLKHHKNYIKTLSKIYKLVLIVEGNHEFYESDISDKPPFKYPKNVILLKNNSYEYKGILFYGGTLWADIMSLPSLDQFNIKQMISDFSIIKDGDNRMSPEKMTKLYNEFVENLYEAHLNLKKDQNMVVISHFAPSMKSVSPGFAGSSLNPYFCNEMDDLIEGLKVPFWIHGHTHSTHDYMIGETRILCNPRGYPREMDHVVYLSKTFEV